MPDRCPENPQSCPMIPRIEALEEWRDKWETFRKEYYKERDTRIERDAKLEVTISEMDEKLDKLLEWREAQQTKPAKRWDSLVDKTVWAVAAAIITFLLARVGL